MLGRRPMLAPALIAVPTPNTTLLNPCKRNRRSQTRLVAAAKHDPLLSVLATLGIDTLGALLDLLGLLGGNAQALGAHAGSPGVDLLALDGGRGVLLDLVLALAAGAVGDEEYVLLVERGDEVLPLAHDLAVGGVDVGSALQHLLLDGLETLGDFGGEVGDGDGELLAGVTADGQDGLLGEILGTALKTEGNTLHLPLVELVASGVAVTVVELGTDASALEGLPQLVDLVVDVLLVFGSGLVVNADGDEDSLNVGDAGRNDKTLVVTVDEDHDTDRTSGETPAVLPNVQLVSLLAVLDLLVRVLDRDVEHLREVLTETVRCRGLDTSADSGNETLNGGCVVCARELLVDSLLTFDNGNSEQLLVDGSVVVQDLQNLLAGLCLSHVRGVTLLPQELSRAKERNGVLELPSHNVVPLVELQRQVTVTPDLLRVVAVHGGLTGRTHRKLLLQLVPATLGNPGDLSRETLDVVLLALQVCLGDEKREVGVLDTHSLDLGVEKIADFLPDHILSLGDRDTLGVLVILLLLALTLLSLALLALALLLLRLRGLLLIPPLLVLLGRLLGRLARLRGGRLGNVEVFHFLLDTLRGHVDISLESSNGKCLSIEASADRAECESVNFYSHLDSCASRGLYDPAFGVYHSTLCAYRGLQVLGPSTLSLNTGDCMCSRGSTSPSSSQVLHPRKTSATRSCGNNANTLDPHRGNPAAEAGSACKCPQCLSFAGGLTKRVGSAAARRPQKYLTSSTLWYSGIFAAAATLDASVKLQRRERWDRAIAEVKKELGKEETAGAVKEEQAKGGLVDEADVLYSLGALEEALGGVGSSFKTQRADMAKRPRAQCRKDMVRCSPRSLESLYEHKQMLWADLRRVTHAPPHVGGLRTDGIPPGIELVRCCGGQWAAFESPRELNTKLHSLMKEHKRQNISTPALLARICYDLSSTPTPPNLDTFNTLLVGLSAANQTHAVSHVIRSLNMCNLRPNETSIAAILNHYTATDDAPAFLKFVETMRGKHRGLALARPRHPHHGSQQRPPRAERKRPRQDHPAPLPDAQGLRGADRGRRQILRLRRRAAGLPEPRRAGLGPVHERARAAAGGLRGAQGPGVRAGSLAAGQVVGEEGAESEDGWRRAGGGCGAGACGSLCGDAEVVSEDGGQEALR
ncbi:hypothetical protein L1887_55534 [Cichorium endivia]|nr:hypothetical protein L1887_55534 [Cichorium endivia]